MLLHVFTSLVHPKFAARKPDDDAKRIWEELNFFQNAGTRSAFGQGRGGGRTSAQAAGRRLLGDVGEAAASVQDGGLQLLLVGGGRGLHLLVWVSSSRPRPEERRHRRRANDHF